MKKQLFKDYGSLTLLTILGLIIVGLLVYIGTSEPESGIKASETPGENEVFAANGASNRGGAFLSGGLRPSQTSSRSSTPEDNLAERLAEVRRKGMERMELEYKIREENFRHEFYGPRFAELGLSNEQAQKAFARLAAMRDKAVTVGDGILELQRQRLAHDREMREVLGEAGYERYRQLESEKLPYRQLVDEIIPFAGEHNVDIEPATRELLVQQLAVHGLTTGETWEGPYDPMPRPGIGVQPAIELYQRTLSQRGNLEPFIQQSGSVLPKEIIDIVVRYFQKEFQQAEDGIAHFSLPEAERSAKAKEDYEQLRRKVIGR